GAPVVSPTGRFSWLQPMTGIWEEPDGTILLLVVPRTFRKTELHLFALVADPAASGGLTARAGTWADAIITAAIVRQQAIDSGAAPDPAVADLLAPSHAWIREALA